MKKDKQINIRYHKKSREISLSIHRKHYVNHAPFLKKLFKLPQSIDGSNLESSNTNVRDYYLKSSPQKTFPKLTPPIPIVESFTTTKEDPVKLKPRA